MALEIERQFLVKPRLLPALPEGHRIDQAYLSTAPEVRVRLMDGHGYLTVKSGGLLTREEYEYLIPEEEARAMLRLTLWTAISKTRHHLKVAGRVWEVDRYSGANEGLWSAEVELAAEDEALPMPPWVALEVTYEPRFKNVNLARQPFSTWPDREEFLAQLAG